jgi:excisionase family DNA binding protein
VTAPALLTEIEAAEALRVCPRTLRKARQEGKLSYVLIGRAVRYTADDLQGFIEASRQDRQPCQRRTNARKTGNIVPFSARQ